MPRSQRSGRAASGAAPPRRAAPCDEAPRWSCLQRMRRTTPSQSGRQQQQQPPPTHTRRPGHDRMLDAQVTDPAPLSQSAQPPSCCCLAMDAGEPTDAWRTFHTVSSSSSVLAGAVPAPPLLLLRLIRQCPNRWMAPPPGRSQGAPPPPPYHSATSSRASGTAGAARREPSRAETTQAPPPPPSRLSEKPPSLRAGKASCTPCHFEGRGARPRHGRGTAVSHRGETEQGPGSSSGGSAPRGRAA
jgi:hypothetical protein